jgi:Tol biopolymer transport system component
MSHLISRGSALIGGALLASLGQAQTTSLVSVDSAGVQGNQFSEHASISGSGRYVAFSTVSTNLVPGDTNNQDDVLVRDRVSGTTTRVSVATGGAQASGVSGFPRISNDGRFVAFQSGAPDLVTGDSNGTIDVFVHDRQTTTTTRVSVSSAGTQANGASYSPSISADGRYIAFYSAATNLVAGDTNNTFDVFVHDRQTGATTRVSVASNGAQGGASSSYPAISADGRYVAFHSSAVNLVAGDTNASVDVFVHDNQTGATSRASLGAGATQSNGISVNAAISANGQFVAFHSNASNLVAIDGNAIEDVFVRDMVAGTTARVSVDSAGLEGNGVSRYAAISADGRYIAFESLANNLVPNDLNAKSDIFVHDRTTHSTQRVSVDSFGVEGNGTITGVSISTNGQFTAFDGYATNLVATDTNNNGDVFVHDSGTPAPFVYCTAGTTTHGCVPSISYSGTPSASAGSGFSITVSSVEGQKQGILFYGINQTGFTAHPWGTSSSFLCVKSPTQRTHSQLSGGTFNGCDGVLSIDWNAYIAANPGALGNPVTPGLSVFAQGWFRDPMSPKTTMLSDALAFVVAP